MRRLGRQEMLDVCVGAGLLGSGGGGSIEEGETLVDRILQFGETVVLVSVDEVADDAWGAAVAGMGSPSASKESPRTYSPTWAVEMLSEVTGIDLDFVVPLETGAGNSLTPMQVAVQKAIPIVDGDPAGRAVPQLEMTTFFLGGISISPLGFATEDGLTAVIKSESAPEVERVTRAIVSETGGVGAIACYLVQGAELKRHLIAGTISRCEGIGVALRAARQAQGDFIASLRDHLPLYILGKGTIESVELEIREGFDVGRVRVVGELPVEVAFQNENMLATRNGRLLAVVPDLICALGKGGVPVTNADLEEGMDVVYIGLPAEPAMRTPEAFALFSKPLGALGFEGEFTPIENLMSSE